MWKRIMLAVALFGAATPLLVGGQNRGYGRCSKCECKRYEGNRDCCGNCGHNYSAHY